MSIFGAHYSSDYLIDYRIVEYVLLPKRLSTLAAISSKRLCIWLVSVRPSVCLSRQSVAGKQLRLSIDICWCQKAAAASVLHCDPSYGMDSDLLCVRMKFRYTAQYVRSRKRQLKSAVHEIRSDLQQWMAYN